jgi:hypothetical protein
VQRSRTWRGQEMAETDFGDPDGRERKRGEDRTDFKARCSHQEARGAHPHRPQDTGWDKAIKLLVIYGNV